MRRRGGLGVVVYDGYDGYDGYTVNEGLTVAFCRPIPLAYLFARPPMCRRPQIIIIVFLWHILTTPRDKRARDFCMRNNKRALRRWRATPMRVIDWLSIIFLVVRPQSDGGLYVNTLKPTYNSVDLAEVELPDVESTFNHNGHAKEDEDTNMLMLVSG